MVYHEKRKINRKTYNYLVSNARNGGKWKKTSKYIGEGELSKEKIKEEMGKFELSLIKSSYLSKELLREIENIKERLKDYLKKSGKTGGEKFNEWFFTELTYNSNAIEGNTLSLQDTSLIINENRTPEGSSLREVHEAKNHKEAIDFLEDYRGEFNERLIIKLHSFILKNIADDVAGKYRRTEVRIRGSDFKPPKADEVPLLITELIQWYRKNKNMHPLELAAIVSSKLVSIHPFLDGNGRVSRLILNYIMKKHGYPEISIYVKDRSKYLNCIRKANEEDYKELTFLLLETLKKNYSFLEKSKNSSSLPALKSAGLLEF